ncbi:TSHZ3 [Cordylochernes scorpioides]|uniref:TSHZ3 n=1 Tax=Cordylochernes scorpioides TaxID=51811 RepID=A0ABY6LQM4_9ARAC|nr:TSHZ3 [Cordylochernes scorpioides]
MAAAEVCTEQPVKQEPPDSEEEMPGEEDEEAPVPMDENTPIDFSLKRSAQDTDSEDKMSGAESPPVENGVLSDHQDSPLDLSMSHKKSSDGPRASKLARLEKNIDKIIGPSWKSSSSSRPHHNSSYKNMEDTHLWNGKPKIKQEKPLSSNVNMLNSVTSSPYAMLNSKGFPSRDKLSIKSENSRQTNRQNPWQTQWMSRSSEQTKDVFTCVWCKESFRSLQEMTYHMKQSIRCGMAGIQASIPPTSPSPTLSSQQNIPSPASSKASSQMGASSNSSNATLLIKESMPLPRKLVRGQDVWLGKGAEQTRQILKCMWCGQSFKTLADMTTHMRVTQHYTNIISQEQIISWRSPEDKLSPQSQVNAVLTCKVCDQAFGSLKELSTHMEKNSHYKEHILRSITEGGGRRRQTRERRKKSLPVRKLLEIERMELNKHGKVRTDNGDSAARSEVIDGKITCEECAEKVDTKDFVQHIKSCNHGSKTQQYIKNIANSESSESKDEHEDVALVSNEEASVVTNPAAKSPEISSNVSSPKNEEKTIDAKNSENNESSVLNAIERLIEKSFDNKGRKHTTTKGILQRLGIDEEVCPPWYPSSSPSKLSMINKNSELGYKPSSPTRNYSSHDELSRKSPLVPSSFHLSDDALGSGRSRVSTPSSLTSPSIPGSPSPHLETFKERTSSPQVAKSPHSPGSTSPSRMPDISHCKQQQQAEKSGGEESCGAATADDLRSSPLLSNEPRTDSSPPHLEPEDEVSTTNDCHDDSSMAESEAEQTPSSSAKRKSQEPSDHPLKQLQKLLDKTDAHLSRPGLPSNPGSILAFSWACNDATTSDSFMKCAFCETHFVSKGAYRHHLSKMHFVKETSEKNTADSSSWRSDNSPKGSPNSSSAAPQGESPHSKFLKYSELAKQLSSKYV